MIFDCASEDDRDLWRQHDILDATRGVWLNDLPIDYLDSEAGIYRYYLADPDGFLIRDPNDRESVLRDERQGKIVLSLKAGKANDVD